MLTKQELIDKLYHQQKNNNIFPENPWVCFVGTMVYLSLGITQNELKAIIEEEPDANAGYLNSWTRVFCTVPNDLDEEGVYKQDINPDNYYGEAKRQIDSTGFSYSDLAKIEFLYETKGFKAAMNMLKSLN